MGKSTIIEIGPIVPDFKEENVIILFGPMATPDLREICVIHQFDHDPNQSLIVGKKFTLGKQIYTINKVGGEANKNFEELGHISIYFKASNEDVLPGSIEVEPAIFPELSVGDEIHF